MADVYRIRLVVEVDVITHESDRKVRRELHERVRTVLTVAHGQNGSTWPIEGSTVQKVRSRVTDQA